MNGRNRSHGSITDIRRFRGWVATPHVRVHALVRYAQRVLGRGVSASQIKEDPALMERCRRGILRNFADADELIACQETPGIYYLIRRRRCLVMRNQTVLTVYNENSDDGFNKARRRRMRRGAPPGIERLEQLLGRPDRGAPSLAA